MRHCGSLEAPSSSKGSIKSEVAVSQVCLWTPTRVCALGPVRPGAPDHSVPFCRALFAFCRTVSEFCALAQAELMAAASTPLTLSADARDALTAAREAALQHSDEQPQSRLQLWAKR